MYSALLELINLSPTCKVFSILPASVKPVYLRVFRRYFRIASVKVSPATIVVKESSRTSKISNDPLTVFLAGGRVSSELSSK